MKKLKLILLLNILFGVAGYSQDCNNDCYHWADCRKGIERFYNIYGQPKSTITGLYDTLTYNIVFYGNNDYIMSFCADRAFYPLNIRLLRPETREVLYDNKEDKYCRTFWVGFYNTQNCLIEVILLADQLNKEKFKEKDNICVGMLIQNKIFLVEKKNSLDSLLTTNY